MRLFPRCDKYLRHFKGKNGLFSPQDASGEHFISNQYKGIHNSKLKKNAKFVVKCVYSYIALLYIFLSLT